MRKLAVLSCALTLALAGCGGSPGSAATVSTASTSVHTLAAAANVVTLNVNGGPGGRWVDMPYVSVTVCVPGSAAECQTFNDIELDTGSYGLRLLAGARDTSGSAFSLALPQVTDAGGSPIVECTQFTDGYSWGPVRTADVHIGGESARALPIQVIGDPAYGTVPSACASTGTSENTVAAFGANGLLGVGPLEHDCGADCLTNAGNGRYYVCPTSGCTPSTAGLAAQVVNPVVDFQTDDNGVIVELPAVPAAGAGTVDGSLVFGIGTEGNNTMTAAAVLPADPSTGDITTTFNGTALPDSYFDTGSNAYFFSDGAIPTCPAGSVAPGFFCPAAPLTFTLTNAGQNGMASRVTIGVGSAVALLDANPGYTAFNDLGVSGSNQSSFDFGLPFFLGRTVFVAIAGSNTSAGLGPYFAF